MGYGTWMMSVAQTARVLDAHKIKHEIRDGAIWSAEEWTKENGQKGETWYDLSGWNRAKIFEWLGY